MSSTCPSGSCSADARSRRHEALPLRRPRPTRRRHRESALRPTGTTGERDLRLHQRVAGQPLRRRFCIIHDGGCKYQAQPFKAPGRQVRLQSSRQQSKASHPQRYTSAGIQRTTTVHNLSSNLTFINKYRMYYCTVFFRDMQ